MKKNIIFIGLLVFISAVAIIKAFQGKEKEFVIVIPSYNNKEWYKKNIDSVLQQNYHNYSVVYADDCSLDGTGDLVEEYAQEAIKTGKLKLIKNQQRKLSLENIYTVLHTLSPQVIVVLVDGDDWLAHNDVLSHLNAVYQNNDVWLTYGQYQMCPGTGIGICRSIPHRVIENNQFRNYQWVTTHLKTFYAGLFHKIKKQDLQYKDTFFAMTGDQAFMFPMLEMAGSHIQFISEVLYTYNTVNPINDWRVDAALQHSIERYIRGSERYAPLKKLF